MVLNYLAVTCASHVWTLLPPGTQLDTGPGGRAGDPRRTGMEIFGVEILHKATAAVSLRSTVELVNA